MQRNSTPDTKNPLPEMAKEKNLTRLIKENRQIDSNCFSGSGEATKKIKENKSVWSQNQLTLNSPQTKAQDSTSVSNKTATLKP